LIGVKGKATATLSERGAGAVTFYQGMIHGEAAAVDIDSTVPNIGATVGNRAITQFQNSLRINLDCAAGEGMMAFREGQPIDYHLSVDLKNLLIRDAISIGIAAYR